MALPESEALFRLLQNSHSESKRGKLEIWDSGSIGLVVSAVTKDQNSLLSTYKCRNPACFFFGGGFDSYQAKVMGKSPMKILLKGSCVAKDLRVPWISHFATAFGLQI